MRFLVIVGLAAATAAPPTPRWGGNASLLAWSATINMTNPADSPDHPHWNFSYYYDGTGKTAVDRYDHQPGQGDEVCMSFCGAGKVQAGEPCTVVNAANGVFLQWGVSGSCCDCTAKIRRFFPTLDNLAVRSDWITANGGKYAGRTSLKPGGSDVDEWIVEGNVGPNHYFATADGDQFFQRFSETKVGKGLKQWDVLSFSPDRPKPALFQQPAGSPRRKNAV